MSVLIKSVVAGGIAGRNNIKPGDTLVSINGNVINDVLDYRFYACYEKVNLQLVDSAGDSYTICINKGEYDDMEMDFGTYMMDKQHSCTNKCIFCFVDQMPKGMRETLYFKDDDDRLSFLFGNYITLTNMKSEEVDRIIKMRISPINISVHTTNPVLRSSMMQNRFAGEVLEYLGRFAEHGIAMNCQLVLCNGINDGTELARSLKDLSMLYPAVQSIACVPVGLTKYREGLAELLPYDKASALSVIETIEKFSKEFLYSNGTRLAYPADEFFVKAGREIPNVNYYEELSQIENGVGIIAAQRDEFMTALDELEPSDDVRQITIATGVDAKPYLEHLIGLIKDKRPHLKCEVIAIINHFFGETITVAGLVTGGDLLKQLDGIELGEQLLLPSCMLRHEQDCFLDDVTLSEVVEKLGIEVVLVENDGWDLLEAIVG